ncbi:hypothetical protein NWFMUON74_30700 [Nocardia wallacei]|uniref:PPE domain-containing protein n=2 Tax=Nocardia wallacei TaxID=480035 RepID=A0A7G1KJF3_9NOCA|nr:hypothetical protein NWFMUON74_30700 [Nocardia wallacei]
MVEMGETWRGISSDAAQAAFRRYTDSLRAQADVAVQTSTLLLEAEGAYKIAYHAMLAVEAELMEFTARQTALLAASTVAAPALPMLMLMEVESAAIFAAAVAVMEQYSATLVPILASFPPPVPSQPVVSGSGGSETPSVSADLVASSLYSPTSDRTQRDSASDSGSSASGDGGNELGPNAVRAERSLADRAITTPSAEGAQSISGVDPATYLTGRGEDMAGSGADAAREGVNDAAGDPTNSGLTEVPPSSSTSGSSATAASSGVIGMTRGGPASMAGATTGFRMPANWQSRPSPTFGAVPTESANAPVPQPVAPRGVVAPQARSRRRGDESAVKVSKVVGYGTPQDIPTLEAQPVVGVIEYGDGDRNQ